jgi:hypothetical protein
MSLINFSFFLLFYEYDIELIPLYGFSFLFLSFTIAHILKFKNRSTHMMN